MNRRHAVAAIAGVLTSALIAGGATTRGSGAQDAASYPEGIDSIEMLVAFSPGGSTDTVARLVAPFLEEQIGVPVHVVNKPGGNGQIGLAELASGPTDGSMIGSANLPSVFTSYLDPNTDVDYDRDSFVPVGGVGATPMDWLLRIRIRRAKEMLENTTLPIDRIARECGFRATSTFRHHFGRVTAVTPARYRRTFGR